MHEGIDAGVRLVDKVAPVIDRVAGQVKNVAGKIGNVASLAAPFTAEIPFVGEVVGGAAALAKNVQGVASTVQKGAKFIERTSKTVKKDANKVAKMGSNFMADPNMADALRYKNQISSMVRANQGNIRDAREQFKRIRNR